MSCPDLGGYSRLALPIAKRRLAVTCAIGAEQTSACPEKVTFPFLFKFKMMTIVLNGRCRTCMQVIEFYCRKCKKTMKMAYSLTGDDDAPVMAGMMIRCHTHKCTRVAILKKFTEGQLRSRTDSFGRCYL